MRTKIMVYDTTLRDGTQREGISLSCDDKLRIAQRLDRLGVAYIEGGWPGSNPKDVEFFERVKDLPLRKCHASPLLVRPAGSVLHPPRMTISRPCWRPDTPVCTVVGKSWDLHVQGCAARPNLRKICASSRPVLPTCKEMGREVIYDAEHFFDGYKSDPDYALDTLRAAAQGRCRYRGALRYQWRHPALGGRPRLPRRSKQNSRIQRHRDPCP